MVIYSIHDDDSAYNLELSKDYVDLVLEGHTHKAYIRPDSKGVYHMQGGGYNESFSYAKIEIDTLKNSVKIKEKSTIVTLSEAKKVEPEIRSESLFEKYSNIISDARKPLATLKNRYESDALRQLISLLYLQEGLVEWGSEYNIFLGGGYLSCRSPYHLGYGEVSYADIYNLFPFDNNIQLCSLKGSDLRKRFTETDNKNYFVSYSDYGNDTKDNIDPNETYYIVTDTYCSDYAPNNLTVVAEYSDASCYARDLVASYITEGLLA